MKALIFFLALQIADVLSTLCAFALGGFESNPIVARLVSLGPVAGLLVAKFIVVGLVGVLLWRGGLRRIRTVNLAYSVIVLWNLSIITRLALRA